MKDLRYIHDIDDGTRLEIPYTLKSGKVVFEGEALVYRYIGSHDVTSWVPLRDILDSEEIRAIDANIYEELRR